MTSQSSLLASPDHSHSRAASRTSLYKSLEDIQNNLNELDNFLTITEDILMREKYRDMELYKRERARKEGKDVECSAVPPLTFKNGKIFCLGDDGSAFGSSNVQITHDIVKQIINNQNNFLCYDNPTCAITEVDLNASTETTPFDMNVSDEGEIFLVHREEDEVKLRSLNSRLIDISPASSISNNIDDIMTKDLLEKSATLECIAAISPA